MILKNFNFWLKFAYITLIRSISMKTKIEKYPKIFLDIRKNRLSGLKVLFINRLFGIEAIMPGFNRNSKKAEKIIIFS